MFVVKGILRVRRGAKLPVGESHLSNSWTVPAHWKWRLYLQVIESVVAEEIYLISSGTEKNRTASKGGSRVKVVSRTLLGFAPVEHQEKGMPDKCRVGGRNYC